MSYSKPMKLCRHARKTGVKGIHSHKGNKWYRKCTTKRERRRAHRDPQCEPQYRRFWGYE